MAFFKSPLQSLRKVRTQEAEDAERHVNNTAAGRSVLKKVDARRDAK
jgi:hypothetical protein